MVLAKYINVKTKMVIFVEGYNEQNDNYNCIVVYPKKDNGLVFNKEVMSMDDIQYSNLIMRDLFFVPKQLNEALKEVLPCW